MITMNQTPGRNADAIWVIRLNLDSDGYMYFSTALDKITLSGTDFDGKVIWKNGAADGLGDLDKSIDVLQGGGIGQVGNFDFSLARYTSHTGTSNFQNDFYPATGKPLLTSKTVDVGIIWAGATSLSEITWLYQYFIQGYSFTTRLNIQCIEYDELANKLLPYYTIQQEADNGISYFTNAPDESYGQVIPIVYGVLDSSSLPYSIFNFAPTVKVSKGHIYKSASHPCFDDAGAHLYKYVDAVSNMIDLTSSGGTYVNTEAGHLVNLASRAQKIDGLFKFQPKGWISGGGSEENAIDDDSATYATLAPNNTMKWQIGADLNEGECGETTGVRADASFIVEWDANGGSVDFEIKYYHPNMGVNVGYSSLVASGTRSGTGYTDVYTFGDGNYDYGSNPKKYDDTAAWSWEELKVLEFHILNKVTSAGTMRIKNIYFSFDNQKIYEVKSTFSASIIRNSGERNYPTSKDKPIQFDSLSATPVYSAIQGYKLGAGLL